MPDPIDRLAELCDVLKANKDWSRFYLSARDDMPRILDVLKAGRAHMNAQERLHGFMKRVDLAGRPELFAKESEGVFAASNKASDELKKAFVELLKCKV